MVVRLASFLQIRRGEARLVAFVAGLFAIIQAGQGIGANAADGLFFIRYGVDYLPYLFMALGALTFVITLFYSAGLIRIPQRLYFAGMLVGFAALLVVERFAILSDLLVLYPILWLSVNIINAILGTFVWNIAGEVCDTRQAKRLFSIFASAGILGGVVGNLLTGLLAKALGTENLLLLFALLILSSLLITREILVRYFHPPVKRDLGESLVSDLTSGYDFVKRSRLLQLSAYSAVLFSVLFFSISFPFSQVASKAFPNEADLAGFLGLFSSATTAVTFLVSLFLANRVYSRIGIVNAILILPLVYLGGFVLWSLNFVLATAVIVRLAQLVFLGGVASTAWSALFNVVPPERRSQVLGFDSGVPSQVGVILSGGLLILGSRVLDTTQIFVMGMLVAVVCAYLVWRMRAAYGDALLHALRAGRFEVFSPSPRAFSGFHGNAQALGVAVTALQDVKPTTRRLAAEIMGKMGDPAAAPPLLKALTDEDVQVRSAVLASLGELGARDTAEAIVPLLADPAPTIRADAIKALTKLQPDPTPDLLARIEQGVSDPDTQVSTEAAVALAQFGEASLALSRLNILLCDDKSDTRVLALDALCRVAGLPGVQPDVTAVVEAARDASVVVRRAACHTLGRFSSQAALDALVDCLNDPDTTVRSAAASSLQRLGPAAAPAVLQVLGAGDDRAQDAALNALAADDPRLFEPLYRYARNEISHAQNWRDIAGVMPSAGQAARLVRELSESRAAQSELRLIKTVGLVSNGEAMDLVAKSVRSHEVESRAQALEALETLGDKRLSKEILPLLEQAPLELRDARLTPSLALAQLLTQKDAWTRALAARAAAELRLHDLAPNLTEAAASDSDQLVRETARQALVNFGETKPMETLQTLSSLERILLLREVPLFAELTPDDLKQIAELAREQFYPNDAMIIHEGEQGNEMYVIATGQVRVTRQVNGDEKQLATRGGGEFIGEMAIIESAPRSATVRAQGDVRTLVIDANAFKSILRDRPEVSLAVLRTLSRRLRERVD